MARKKAIDGIQDLIDRTGGPKVSSVVTVDQVYAQNQHETLWFRHPRGGQAKFLEAPMFAEYPKWFQQFANRLLRSKSADEAWHAGPGSALQGVVPKFAPVEFGDLRQSAGLQTKVGTAIRHERPPIQPRLTAWELDAKDHMRNLGLGYR
jgi:hypothetical protein